ncbi:class I SAM-dependent methyltransferase [Nanoarchaeota archaeon NZ13-N]|nr:MAG: class I SAM-dependent methyltransferase [Nanoarchaeota archaeon NZ13-N]
MSKEENLRKEYEIVEGFESYDIRFEDAKKRLKKFEEFYNNNKNFFGKKILDLACGGGLFSNFLAEKRHIVTGVDILDPMLKIAKENSPKNNPPKYIKANLLEFVPEEEFDTTIFLGNSIPHFSPKDFAKVLLNIREKTRYFIIAYRDSVSWGFEGRLKHIIIEEGKDYDVIDLYKGYDGEKDSIIKYRIIYPKNDKVVLDYHLYNPGIVEGIMFAVGFRLVKREKYGPMKSLEEYIDIYEKV